MELIRILYVDDYCAETLEDLFRKRFKNAEFEWVVTNQDALNRLKSRGYDVVIYDMGMEVRLDTFAVTRKIKELKPSCILLATSVAGKYIPKELPEHIDGTIRREPLWQGYAGDIQRTLSKYGLKVVLVSPNEPESTEKD